MLVLVAITAIQKLAVSVTNLCAARDSRHKEQIMLADELPQKHIVFSRINAKAEAVKRGGQNGANTTKLTAKLKRENNES